MRRINRYKTRGCALRKEAPTYEQRKGRIVAHLGIYVERPVMEELRRLSQHTNVNMSAHITKAIKQYLNRCA